MKVIDVMIINENLLKLMSKFDIKPKEYIYIDMYREFKALKYERNEKFEYVISSLADKYKISKSKTKRLIKKMELEVESN